MKYLYHNVSHNNLYYDPNITTRITKNYEFKKGVGIDSTIKSTETRILLAQFTLQKFNPYFWHNLK